MTIYRDLTVFGSRTPPTLFVLDHEESCVEYDVYFHDKV